jgi:hypothetical protein
MPRPDRTHRFKGNGGDPPHLWRAPGLPRTDQCQVHEIGAYPVDHTGQPAAVGRAVPQDNRKAGPVPRQAAQGVRQPIRRLTCEGSPREMRPRPA